ncbi:CTTNBP2 [Symbiodinium natans]|uniref:CTTNBP2 protein n=1 Tax=Symbiodinium natans TaxID=878477 RepID=A0A812HZB1_9DINO|nr:CTTNBP2 [Symbiodinium natans]
MPMEEFMELPGKGADAAAAESVVLNGFCDASEAQADELVDAVWQNRARDVERILSRPQDPNLTAAWGWTPLLRASVEGHLDVARLLLEAASAVDKTLPNGTSPLLAACEMGHRDLARMLLESHADVNNALLSGETPLFMAAQNGANNADEVTLMPIAKKPQAPHMSWRVSLWSPKCIVIQYQ